MIELERDNIRRITQLLKIAANDQEAVDCKRLISSCVKQLEYITESVGQGGRRDALRQMNADLFDLLVEYSSGSGRDSEETGPQVRVVGE